MLKGETILVTRRTLRVNRLRSTPPDEWVHMVRAALLILQMMERGLPPKITGIVKKGIGVRVDFLILFRSSILVFALGQVFSAGIKVFE